MAEGGENKPLYDWRDLPTMVTVVAAIALSLSVARSLGFFFQIDLKLMPLLSLQDEIVNSLPYVPLQIFAWGVGLWTSQMGLGKTTAKILDPIIGSKAPSWDLKVGAVIILIFFLFF